MMISDVERPPFRQWNNSREELPEFMLTSELVLLLTSTAGKTVREIRSVFMPRLRYSINKRKTTAEYGLHSSPLGDRASIYPITS